jgi:choline monooxygenase
MPSPSETLSIAAEGLARPIGDAVGLPSRLYTDLAVLALERARIFGRHWIAIGHAGTLAQPGDVEPVSACGAPLVLARGRDGVLRGFHNVCGHRGVKLVAAPCRGRPTLVCPYHGWAYDLAGKLRATPDFGGHGRHTAPNFEPVRHGLKPVRLAEGFGGIVFADLSGAAPAFADWAAPLLERWSAYRFEALRHAHVGTCEVAANWKLVAENFVDTLHLEWVHPQVVGYSKPEDHYDIIAAPAYGTGSHGALSPDPAGLVVPLFPELPAELARRGEFMFLYPNLILFLMPNQVFSIILDPVAPDRTLERLDFAFVEAGDGPEAEAARQRWIASWTHLNSQDFTMLERLQQGRGSPGFTGGCFSSVMDQVAHALQRRIVEDLQS